MHRYIGRADTNAWILQVWAAFTLAVLVTCVGIYHLPVDLWLRGYVTMGFFFVLGSTFTLAKMIRDNHYRQVDTSAWVLQVWIAFGVALVLMFVGLYNLPVDWWVRGYMAVGLFFTISASFTLAKTIRDNAEAKKGLPPELAASLTADGASEAAFAVPE
jgi:hypothetical protein